MATSLRRLGIAVEIKVEYGRLMQALDEYRVKFNRDTGKLIRQQMRLLMRDVVKLTSPFRSRHASGESWNEQLRAGQNSISRDAQKVFGSIEELAAHNTNLGPAIQTALQKNNMAVLGKKNSLPELLVKARVIDEIGLERGDKIIDQPVKDTLDRFRLDGRVKNRLPWKIWVKRTFRLRAFIRQEWLLIGKLKGGWAAACDKFGVSIPGWVKRHASGQVIDASDLEGNPHALARNTVSYAATRNIDTRATLYAMQDRRAALERQLTALAERKITL